MADRRPAGEEIRRAVLGEAHVNRSQGTATEFDRGFVDLITESAWGTVWASDAIPRRERSMITLALLAGLGNFEEFELHLRATVNTGATREDIREVLHHVAIYAGVPRANHAFKLARSIYAELEDTGDD
ncbi:4-carboxymuconolactone decarboxylase [Pseudooceanicola batsensis HTCC2597]|uniref:4-carboxymuconolactone decarboxylase n=1 Tax=Pseudooceanicola batsensis (strain ATCC BAA-863 / DSM 15984 / KCTC 12145 / HTCC2597) TaxID=252305 RepID=A3U2A0_PSEBH|nr:4-carboxymuconolactone decarboxylase [Pseudooceanicola batsensis]EAQ01700.1 4-carboxymuconolactone decarboxylase [Pseudooceanicola batsensis HTCC2597]